MAATLLAALDGLAHGLCPSLGLARVGPAFPWLKFTFSILFLVVLVALFLVCVDVSHLLSGKGYVHKEDKAFWKDFGMAGKACSLEDPFLTTGPFAVVTAAASSAAVGKYVKFAAAASCSALILSITLDSGFCEFVNLFWCGIVVALSLSEGEDSVLLLRILTLVCVFNNTALGITTLSQGQVDLHRGVVRPWGKSLPHMQQPHSAGALRGLVLAWRRAAALGYIFTLVDAFLLVVIIAIAFVGSWQQAAAARGCHTAFWAKATPRVDVGDTPNTMTTASPRCGLWLGNLDKVGKGKEGDKEKDEEKEEVRTVRSSFPVFLRTLSGRTVVLTAVGNSISDLLQRIEEVTQIPQHHWYCHVNGSPLSPDSAPHCLHRDCTIVMCARLKGGAPTIPGEWFCQVCQRGGCWPARTHCFRCGCRKGEKTFRAPPRERQALGRAPPAQGTASCPTERRPAPVQGSKKPPNNKLTQQAILAALKTMNVPVELMQQLQATLDPPAPPEIPAKRLLDLQIKLGRAEKEQDRLKNVHDKKQEELMHAQMRLDAKMNEVREVLAAIEEVKKEMDFNINVPPPAAPPVFETGAMDEEESPEDDAYLGLNHEHFPAMEVGEIGAPLGTSKRPRQSLEVDPTPSFDITVNAIASYDSDQIQQLLHIAQMQLDTNAAASQICG